MYGQPPGVTKEARSELRADAKEIAKWRAAAKRAGLGLSAWLRVVANEAAKHDLATALVAMQRSDR